MPLSAHRTIRNRAIPSRAPGRRYVALLILVVAAIAVGALVAGRRDRIPSVAETTSGGSALAVASISRAANAVEVPDVSGLTLAEARLVLKAAGLSTSAKSSPKKSDLVDSQVPSAGEVVQPGTEVSLTLWKPVGTGDPSAAYTDRLIVCIDPGHQKRADDTPEPIGPGSSETKPRITSGTSGIVTEIPEYEIALQIAMNLKARLEKAGAKVVMTRTTNDVDLGNRERAELASKAKADLFIRIHADGSPNETDSGVRALYTGRSKWTKNVSRESERAAARIQSRVVKATGAVDLGRVARTDLAGFNYFHGPAVLVSCGFPSNPIEDRLLASPHYQDTVASGIARGALEYLRSR